LAVKNRLKPTKLVYDSQAMVGQLGDSYRSVEQIADYLGVSRDTVYTWISAKGMPAHRLGRLWKFKQEEVDSWVKSGGAAPRLGPDQDREDNR